MICLMNCYTARTSSLILDYSQLSMFFHEDIIIINLHECLTGMEDLMPNKKDRIKEILEIFMGGNIPDTKIRIQ